ncbi:hypothetical protein RHSP_83308 [Rhizobium freirei PRF 81]|uniref:Uncharacterized protein n=1 Tax=Rhizobium freirei PRF 81 TaxID=363754 RepID=N6UTH4_9HYPH|nr:hypothetical protein [Rhizobium freirei]ENN84086.1 hypothetical protein RHSP_83308 [Rhizobium freirei PRF 81]
MRSAALALILTALAAAGPASAISRYESLSKTCAAVQQLIASERAVILRYPAKGASLVLYDRFVSGNGQCSVSDYAARTYIPTRDNPLCPVYSCKPSSVFNPN